MPKKSRPVPKELKPITSSKNVKPKSTNSASDSRKTPKTKSSKPKPYKFSAIRIIVLFLILLIPIGIFIGVTQLVKNQPAKLSPEYYDKSEIIDLSAAGYDEIVENQKTAIIFIDQLGCTTADGLRDRLTQLSKQDNFSFNRLMWSEMRQTPLKDIVQYYPSIVILKQGTVAAHLRADSDADAPAYNELPALETWLERYVILNP